jgi:hypothetical protein
MKYVFYLVVAFIIIAVPLSLSTCSWEGDINEHFKWLVTNSNNVTMIKVEDSSVGFDIGIKAHFTTTPKVIDSIIASKKLELMSVNSLNVENSHNKIHPVGDWLNPPIDVLFYKKEEYTGGDFLSKVIVLQHNKDKNEVFYSLDTF